MKNGKLYVFAGVGIAVIAAIAALLARSGHAPLTAADTDNASVSLSSETQRPHRDIVEREAVQPSVLAVRLRAALADGQPIASILAEWIPHAGEDPGLSMALARELLECTALPSNDEEFMAGDPAAKASPAARAAAAADLNRRAAVCDGLGNTEQERYDLVRAAASAGDLQAQIGYTFFAGPYVRSEASMARDGIREQYKRDAVRFADSALASKTREAYKNAYEIHSSDLMGAKDPVAAYAYLLLATEGFSPALVSRMRAEASASMTTAQLQQAQRMAVTIGPAVN